MHTFKKHIPLKNPQRNQSTSLWAIAHVGNKGRGEEEGYHTFGLPLFIWYLVANEENAAQNKKKAKPSKREHIGFIKYKWGCKGWRKESIPIFFKKRQRRTTFYLWNSGLVLQTQPRNCCLHISWDAYTFPAALWHTRGLCKYSATWLQIIFPRALDWVDAQKPTQEQAIYNPTNAALNFHFFLSSVQKGFCSAPRKTDVAQYPLYTQNSSDSSVSTVAKVHVNTWMVKNSSVKWSLRQ